MRSVARERLPLKGGCNKYEYNPGLGGIKCDRLLEAMMSSIQPQADEQPARRSAVTARAQPPRRRRPPTRPVR